MITSRGVKHNNLTMSTRSLIALLPVLACLAWVQQASAQWAPPPTEDQIASAIKLGLAKKSAGVDMEPRGSSPWRAIVFGPLHRIQDDARTVTLAAIAPYDRSAWVKPGNFDTLVIKLVPIDPVWHNVRVSGEGEDYDSVDIKVLPGSRPKKGEFLFIAPEDAIKPASVSRIYQKFGERHSYEYWVFYALKDLPPGDFILSIDGKNMRGGPIGSQFATWGFHWYFQAKQRAQVK